MSHPKSVIFTRRSTKKRQNRHKQDTEIWTPLPVPLKKDDGDVLWPLVRTPGILAIYGIVDCEHQCVELKNDAAAIVLYFCGYFGNSSLSRDLAAPHLIGKLRKPDLKKHLICQKEVESFASDFHLDHCKYLRQMKSFARAFGYFPSKKKAISLLYPGVENSVEEDSVPEMHEQRDLGSAFEDDRVAKASCFISKAEESEKPLKLHLYEAFFLSYGLGVLNVRHDEKLLNLQEMWKLYTNLYKKNSDLEFPILYAAYHYYRSKGWVVKSGLRYGCHFVLYKEGPSFHHSLFGVTVVKQQATSVAAALPPWQHMLGFHRAIQGVAKEPLVCFVVVPNNVQECDFSNPKIIERLEIQSILLERWVPSQERTGSDEFT